MSSPIRAGLLSLAVVMTGILHAENSDRAYWSSVAVDASLPKGRQLFLKFCEQCHGRPPPMPPNLAALMPGIPPGMPPPGPPGTNELRVKYQDQVPAALEDRTDLTPEAIRLYVRRGVGVMPPVRKTELSDSELQMLADYLARKSR